MSEIKHSLGEEGSLGKFSEREIESSIAKLGGESPKEIEEGFEQAAAAAKHDRENRVIVKNVRESAEQLLDAVKNDPKSVDMLADAYVDSIVNARVAMGRKEDEEGVRMMLGAAIKAIGEGRGIVESDQLVKKIAGSVEAVEDWYKENLPPQNAEALKYSDEDIDLMLAKLDAEVQRPAPAEAGTAEDGEELQ